MAIDCADEEGRAASSRVGGAARSAFLLAGFLLLGYAAGSFCWHGTWFGEARSAVSTHLRLSNTLIHPTAPLVHEDAPRKPHIVMVVFDDVGHADTTVYRSEREVGWSTPNLQRLANKEGVLLTNYYTQTVCSPTRSALMTSRYPFRTGLQHKFTVQPGTLCGIPQDTPTLAELLNEHGYVSHAVGKWHLGMASVKQTPTGRGFKSYIGIMQGQADYWNHQMGGVWDFWDEDPERFPHQVPYKRAAKQHTGNHSEVLYRARVNRIVKEYVSQHPKGSEKRAQHPLFLYMAHQSLHLPIMPINTVDKRCGKASAARKEYCALAVELDDSFGLLEKNFKDAGLWDETLVVVTTDNGGMVPWGRKPTDPPGSVPPFPASFGSNYPLRGSKVTQFEGGVRSLGFVTGGWLHSSARGAPFNDLAHAVDLPALALRAAVGHAGFVKYAQRHRLDGNPLQTIRLKEDAELTALEPRLLVEKRTEVPINIISGGKDYSAIRFGKWKLLVGSTHAKPITADVNGWFPLDATSAPIPPPTIASSQRTLLFDLEADPTETTDLTKQHPEIVREGQQRLQAYVESGDYREPQDDRRYVAGFPKFHDNTWAPWYHHDIKLESLEVLGENDERLPETPVVELPQEARAVEPSGHEKPRRPHIVMLVFDDVGHADTTVYRSEREVGWSTPTLQRLATKEGVLLTNYYTQTVCSPTRSSLLTSLFPFRTGLQHKLTVSPGTLSAIPLDVSTVPEILHREAGYVSHAIGKWHLGMASVKNTPTGRGFTSYLGIMQAQGDYWKQTMSGGLDFWDVDPKLYPNVTPYKRVAKHLINGTHSEVMYRARLERVVREYAEEHPRGSSARSEHPLFLYVAHQSLHVPIMPIRSEPLRCASASQARREYCAMAVQLDDSVSLLEKQLKRTGLWEETLIVATTDNGGMVPWSRGPRDRPEDNPPFPASLGSNYPLRGSKMTHFEGGVRSLAFVTGGWVHPASRGRAFSGLAHAVDLPALALRAALGDTRFRRVAETHNLDGNPIQHIRLQRDADLHSRAVVFGERNEVPINIISGGKDYSAIRFGRWKLLVGATTIVKNADGWFPLDAMTPPIPAPAVKTNTLLYDIESDPYEKTDVSGSFPLVVKEGLERIQAYVSSGRYREPQNARVYLAGQPQFNHGSWAPFVKEGVRQESLEALSEEDERAWAASRGAQPAVAEPSSTRRPHIVMVVFDDVGHADTTVYRPASEVGWSTPNLERLANAEGVLLSSYYTQAVCSPTRSALMTSRYPFRTGLQHKMTFGPGKCGIPLDTPTLAELLHREAGYVSHAVGKWHLGMASVKNTPTGRGFSSYLGILQGMADFWTLKFMNYLDFWDVKVGDAQPYKHAAKHYVGNHTELLYRERLRTVIEAYAATHPKSSPEREAEPLFVYMAHQSLHIPIEAIAPEPKRCRGASKARREYCAMAVQLDDSFGLLEAALKKADMWDETLIVATTDNGGMVPYSRKAGDDPSTIPPFPASVGSNYPLRGSKTTLFEGGVRSLGFVTGGFLHPSSKGRAHEGLAHAVDLPALALRAALGESKLQDLIEQHRLDGNPLQSIRLKRESSKEIRFPEREELPINIISHGRDYSAIRFGGKWKLIVGAAGAVDNAEGWFPLDAMTSPTPPPAISKSQRVLLFDILADPNEERDLTAENPRVVQEGLKRIQAYVRSGDYREPQDATMPLAALPWFHDGAWGPFLKEGQVLEDLQLLSEDESEKWASGVAG